MLITVRYVTARPSLKNPKRWYWQRPGYALVRLPGDEQARWVEASRLNKQADEDEKSEKSKPARYGTVSWAVHQFERSERFAGFARNTQDVFRRWLRYFDDTWGSLPLAAITRKVVIEFCKQYKERKAARAKGVLVLTMLFQQADYEGLSIKNPCTDLRLTHGAARRVYFTDDEIEILLKHCASRMHLTVLLLLYTAQRPGDVLAMRWMQYDGEFIRVRQQKTGKLVEVWCHKRLKAALDAADRIDGGLIVGTSPNVRTAYKRFQEEWRRTVLAAGLGDKQARDLRRTAVVQLSEMNNNVQKVAAITGHSVERTTKIIEHYLVPTKEMTVSAVRSWERRGESNVRPEKV